jgi:hypothetical protein
MDGKLRCHLCQVRGFYGGPRRSPCREKHNQKTVLTVFALGAGEAAGKDAAFELTAAGSSG